MALSTAKKAKDEWRYERKFPTRQLDAIQLKSSILSHPGFFSNIYEKRQIHNIYFDSLNFDAYHENLSGVGYRRKTRIRWYSYEDGRISDPWLEIKIRNNLLGTKHLYPLKFNELPAGKPHTAVIQNLIDQCSLIPEFFTNGHIQTVFYSNYCREYFLSQLHPIRLTLDSSLTFTRLSDNHIFLYSTYQSSYQIIEMKYDPQIDHIANTYCQYLPVNKNKFSKYVYGVEMLDTSTDQ